MKHDLLRVFMPLYIHVRSKHFLAISCLLLIPSFVPFENRDQNCRRRRPPIVHTHYKVFNRYPDSDAARVAFALGLHRTRELRRLTSAAPKPAEMPSLASA